MKTSGQYRFSASEVVCGCPSPDARGWRVRGGGGAREYVNNALKGSRVVRSRGCGNLKAFVFVTQIRKTRCLEENPKWQLRAGDDSSFPHDSGLRRKQLLRRWCRRVERWTRTDRRESQMWVWVCVCVWGRVSIYQWVHVIFLSHINGLINMNIKWHPTHTKHICLLVTDIQGYFDMTRSVQWSTDGIWRSMPIIEFVTQNSSSTSHHARLASLTLTVWNSKPWFTIY